MKRTIVSLMLILSFIICLSACAPSNENGVYDRFNGFSNSLGKYTIEICTNSPSGNKVTETYDVTVEGASRTVNYRIERINTITVDGDKITVPEDSVTTDEGTLHTAVGGQDTYALPAFKFSDSALKNFKNDTATFSADVVSAKEFMGVDLDGADIQLTGHYLDTGFTYVTLSYTTESGNKVTVTYTYK